MSSSLARFAALSTLALVAAPASAQIPDAKTLLGAVGLDPGQIDQVMSGQIVSGAIKAASERELVAAMAFQVNQSPADVIKLLKSGIGNQVDPAMIAYGPIATATPADFAKLSFGKDAEKRAKEFLEAEPGGSLNLSAEEIASFQTLAASKPAPPAVEAAVREMLAARTKAYQAKGLAGIAPYALDDGKTRSAADELRTMSNASKALQKYVPAAFSMLTTYPAGKPAGTEELFRWTYFDAHGTPTISLQHVLFVPDGNAYLAVQRMFYVSAGFNAEQALIAVVPVEGGSVLVYGNRTSTDQVAGFGGSAKRSIGSKMLESQLDTIFQKARAKAQ